MIVLGALGIVLAQVYGGQGWQGYVSLPSTDPCHAYLVPVAESQLAVFLAPVDSVRSIHTRRALEATLFNLRTLESVDRPEMTTCPRRLVHEICWFADATILEPFVEYLATEYESFASKDRVPLSSVSGFGPPSTDDYKAGLFIRESLRRTRWGKGRVREHAEAALAESRERCAPMRSVEKVNDGCNELDLVELARARDPIAVRLLTPLRKRRLPTDRLALDAYAAAAWLELGTRFEEPARFPAAALPLMDTVELDALAALEEDEKRAARGLLKNWAIDEMVGSMDPTGWHPDDVVALVRHARQADATFVRGDQGPSHKPEPGYENPSLGSLLPLGAVNAFNLVQPSSYRISGVNAPFVVHLPIPLDDSHGFQEAPYIANLAPWVSKTPVWQHFPLEFYLYEREWRRDHPDPVGYYGHEQRNYVIRRWFETDQAARHPDLRTIRQKLGMSPPP